MKDGHKTLMVNTTRMRSSCMIGSCPASEFQYARYYCEQCIMHDIIDAWTIVLYMMERFTCHNFFRLFDACTVGVGSGV